MERAIALAEAFSAYLAHAMIGAGLMLLALIAVEYLTRPGVLL